MKLGEVISSSWKTLFKRYGITLLTFLALAVISFAFAFLVIVLNKVPVIGTILAYVLVAVAFVVVPPIAFGQTKQFIALYNGENVKPFDFLKNGFSKFGMVWKLQLRLFLKYLIPIILMVIGFVCYWIIGFGYLIYDVFAFTGIHNADFFNVVVENAELFGCVSLLLFVVGIWWITVLLLKYIFVYNELAHHENSKTVKEILKLSEENMKGNAKKLLLIELMFFCISTVIGFVPYIGGIINLLLYVPFVQYVTVAFYEHVRREKMPDYDVTENMDIGGENSSGGPIQNI